MTMPRYYRGYPRRHLRDAAKGIALSFGCLVPILALAVAGASVRFAAFRQDGSWLDLTLGAVAGIAVVFFSVALISGIRDSATARIVPYFDKRIGLKGMNDFGRGAAIARYCRQLDALATQAALPALSSFGFHDDLRGEELEWHRSAEGAQAIAALREAVIAATALPGRDDILQDLSVMEAVLLEAAKQDRLFCFILRGGRDKFISPMEMDRRAGSFC